MYSRKITITDAAILCHELNKLYCEMIGDYSQDHWERAEEWQRESAINGVRYHLANPNSKPEDSHNSWLEEKMTTGWVYGEVKDPETKQHPCMVPYEELPELQKIKDSLFLNSIRSLELIIKQ